MRALEFITGHVTYNPAYTYKFQLKTTTGLLSFMICCKMIIVKLWENIQPTNIKIAHF